MDLQYPPKLPCRADQSRGATCEIRIRYPRSNASRPIKPEYRCSQAPEDDKDKDGHPSWQVITQVLLDRLWAFGRAVHSY